jgi:lipopolysaccharide biosynthesis glycosyltransferase
MTKQLREKSSDDQVKIFYACDENFIKFLIVSLTSLKENADKNRKYKINILCSKMSKETEDSVLILQDSIFSIEFVNVEGELKKLGKTLPLRDYYSKTTYYRLFIPELFQDYDKALYIDSDTIVLGDISKLYDLDVSNYYVGACHEQVMVQNEVFGSYVEKVMGINRNEFFNAGVLLINCDLFRKDKLFDEFVKLLGVYDFRVTQDEDYLNVMCKNKVLWLPQDWNVEVYGDINVKRKEYKLIHYIMVSKPWHYEDCRLSEHFWGYASKTLVYEDIKKELINYSEVKRNKDIASQIALVELARDEIARSDNFFNKISESI